MADNKGVRGTGRYRIQAVAKATGVSAATLRAWERRYGVPTPNRTASAYRIYSDADIALIQAMRDHCDQGIAPAEAARLVLQSVAEQKQKQRQAAAVEPAPIVGVIKPAAGIETPTVRLADAHRAHQERILQAIEKSDPVAIEKALRASLVAGTAYDVYDGIFGPVLREVGRRWHEGTFDVAQEHMASELMVAACKDLLRLVQPAPAAPCVLLGCVADETHGLPLYGVAFRLAQRGVRAVMLGTRTPPSAIAHAVQATNPLFVGLSATLGTDHNDVREAFAAYARAAGSTPWVVGGAGSASLADAVEDAGGIVAGSDWIALVDELLDERQASGATT
ncbi:MAG: MerR family transcriptional regulator [Myxococcales bacterium]|nr:MerR family transcriptional regulator [Myxococcales bacterium]